MKEVALFLDRDGVINKEKNYLYKMDEFEFIDGVFNTLSFFQKKGFLLFVITNQSGIARGYYSEKDFNNLTDWMTKEFVRKGIYITKVYYCPYHFENGFGKYKKESFFRKPNPGMILQARDEFNIDLEKSILVGDKETDIEAGINAGIKYNILVKSGHEINSGSTKAYCILESIKYLPEIQL